MTTDHGLCVTCGACPRCDPPCDHSSAPVRDAALRPEEAERLAAIRERESKTTPGPLVWTATDEKGNGWVLGCAWDKRGQSLGPGQIEFEVWKEETQEYIEVVGRAAPIMEDEGATCNYADPEFFAHARDDVPWLLTLVARLAGEGGTARERALDAALGFAAAAIADAIYTEDGLDGAAGERVLCLLAEAKQYGTHDARAVGRAEMLDLFGLACPDDLFAPPTREQVAQVARAVHDGMTSVPGVCGTIATLMRPCVTCQRVLALFAPPAREESV